jgi:AraC family transcriptional regulator
MVIFTARQYQSAINQCLRFIVTRKRPETVSNLGRFVMQYGERLGECWRVKCAPSIVARVLRDVEIAATEIRSDITTPGMSKPIPPEDAYLVGLQLRDCPRHEYWEHGQQAPICDLHAGETCFYDLKRDPRVLLDKPFHSLHFYLPRSALDAIADDAHAPRIDNLHYKPGAGVADSTIEYLGRSMLAAFGCLHRGNQLFVNQVVLAVGGHVAETYGAMRTQSRVVRGGLAPWQERRAKELLRANLNRALTLEEIAKECRLSVSYFSRAFCRTVGVAPYKWLSSLRIGLAKDLLRHEETSLADVALTCGFADQSHFTRAFRRNAGMSPGAWRRTHAEGAALTVAAE